MNGFFNSATFDHVMTATAALSMGIAVGCALYIFLRGVSQLKVEDGVTDDDFARSVPLIFRIFIPLIPNVRFISESPAFENMRANSAHKMDMAGLGGSISGGDWLALKIIFVVIGFLVLLFAIFSDYTLLGIVLALALAIYPGAWLRATIKRRQLQIMKALPNVLDLLTLSVESGKDFLSSLRDILKKRKRDALSEELLRAFQEIQLGKKRSIALKEMSERVRHEDLSAMVNAIVQAEELGVSIGQLLRIQGDLLRNKRFTRAEKLANETPVKILLPVILFIFPAVLVILILPIMMQAFKVFK